LIKIATGKEARPPELDTFAAAFAIADENQEKVANEKTLVLLKRFSRNPDVEKARVEFERAQKVEERFHTEFDGLGPIQQLGGERRSISRAGRTKDVKLQENYQRGSRNPRPPDPLPFWRRYSA
jgi:hypothetical protein